MSQDELAALAGVSDTTWKQHRAQGAPVPKRRADLMPWLRRYQEWRRVHGKVQAAPKEVDPEEARWTRERKKWLAMLARLEFAVRMREMVPRKDVIDFAARACLTVRNKMLALVGWAESRLEHADRDTIRDEMTAQVHGILDELAQGLDPNEHAATAAAPAQGAQDPGELSTAAEDDG